MKLNMIRFQRKCLWCMGCWPRRHHPLWGKIMYAAWTIIVYMFILGFYVQIQAINVLVNLGNIDEMMASLFLLLTNMVHSFKYFICIYRSEEFDQMIKYSLEIKSKAKTQEEFDVIRRSERDNFIDLAVYFVTAFLCITGWALVPVLEGNTKDANRALPLPAWYPFDKNLSPAYELSYSHQIVGIGFAAFNNMCLDSLMAGLMGLATCELELLMIRLKKLANDDRTYISQQAITDKRFREFDYESEWELEERLYKELCDCVILHEEIYSLARTLQTCISPVAFTQFSVSGLIFCASLYQIAMQSGDHKSPIGAFATLVYLGCMLWELFMYCRGGNELLIVSTKISEAAYECNWYNCSKRFRAALRFLMMRSLRPIKMTAGSFVDLSLHTFVTIVKASYSFFTVIQNSK